MAKLQAMKRDYERRGFHLQRLYKRRKADENGIMRSTFGSIMDPIVKSTKPTSKPTDGVTKEELNASIQDLLNKFDKDKDNIIDQSEISDAIAMEDF
jgi:hypothetical protein